MNLAFRTIISCLFALLAPAAVQSAVTGGSSTLGLQASLRRCTAQGAIITLVDERLLTRTAITIAGIAEFASPATLRSGDPRLVQLDRVVHGVVLEPPAIMRFDVRMLLRVTCRDGTRRVIAGSATEPDGTVHLSIDSVPASTRSPVRRGLDGLRRGGAPASR